MERAQSGKMEPELNEAQEVAQAGASHLPEEPAMTSVAAAAAQKGLPQEATAPATVASIAPSSLPPEPGIYVVSAPAAADAPPSTAPLPPAGEQDSVKKVSPAPAAKARSIKTPVQKEALEAAYQIKKFPEEDMRRALGERIGLTEQQVQVWFSHKRRKDKKDQEEAAARLNVQKAFEANANPAVPPSADIPSSELPIETQAGTATLPQQPNGSVTAPAAAASVSTSVAPAVGQDTVMAEAPASTTAAAVAPAAPASAPAASQEEPMPQAPPPREPSISPEERAEIPELIALARALMPVPFRENGPSLVYEFDDPPRMGPNGTYLDVDLGDKRKRVASYDGEDGDDAANRKRRSSAGARAAGWVEASRIERERKRMEEKAERDRKKQELARSKEEDRMRALQEREQKKLEVQAEKDRRARERKEKLSERRKEKEMLKALQAQEKQATRLRQRDGTSGPRDDLDLEWDALLAKQREEGYGSDTGGERPTDHAPPTRPDFPPPRLGLLPAFTPELGDAIGGNMMWLWAFLHSFGALLGIRPVSVEDLLESLVQGEPSRLLGEMHVALLRVLQADMEEAHATGAMQSGSAINFLDRAIVNCAGVLEEAWAWGFDVDAWRAHVNVLTWPEVLRQMAICWGLGCKRPKPKKEVRPKMGTEGEDIVADEAGGLKLRLPIRFGVGTVKAAAWHVLAEAGAQGLTITEIARQIQRSGLRDLRTSKTPEASVAGALSRDVIFCRIAPATYALQAVLSYHSKLASGESSLAGTKDTGKEVNMKDEAGNAEEDATAIKPEIKAEGAGEAAVKQEPAADGDVKKEGPGSVQVVKREEGSTEPRGEEDDDDDESSDEEGEDEHDQAKIAGEPWVPALQTREYRSLSLLERVAMLKALVHLTLDGPTLRNTLEARLEESQRVRKQMWEDSRKEKQRRQAEAAAKAKVAADEAQRVMELFRSQGEPGGGSEAPSEQPAPGGTLRTTPSANLGSVPPSPPHASDTLAPTPASGTPAPSDRAVAGDVEKDAQGAAASKRPPSEAMTNPPSEAGHERTADDEDLSGAAAAKQRQLQRAETIRKAEEANATRGEPLGLDRRYNKYWRFATCEPGPEDPCTGRLLVESHVDGTFRLIGTPAALEGLMESLDRRGAREGPLYNALLRYKDGLLKSMPSHPLTMPPELAERPQPDIERIKEDHRAWVRSVPCQAVLRCPRVRQESQLSHEDPRLAKLQHDLLAVEAALPEEALQDGWESATWRESVSKAGDAAALRDALGSLEAAVGDLWISPHFQRTPLLVRGAWLPSTTEVASAVPGNNGEVQVLPPQTLEGATPDPEQEARPLAWLPASLAAVALRFHALDAALVYKEGQHPAREDLQAYKYIQRPVQLSGVSRAEERGEAPSCSKTWSGPPVGVGGRSRSSLFPPFPQNLLAGPPATFDLPWDQLRKEIADEAVGILPPPLQPPKGASGHSKTPRSRGKGPTRGGPSRQSGSGRGKGSKASKASQKLRGKRSSLLDEFDRQSEEEEAEAHYGFSTPGVSEQGSDEDEEPHDEELEISD